MHEAALFADLRRKLVSIGADAPGERIVRARLRIGGLSHVTEATLRERWPELVQGTPAEGCRLEVDVETDPTAPMSQSLLLVEVGLQPAARS